METVRWDTDEMRDWSTGVNTNIGTYSQEVADLFSEIETFVNADFKGGVAEEFFNMYENNKNQFTSTTEITEEAIRIVKEKANNIENTEQELVNNMKRNNRFTV